MLILNIFRMRENEREREIWSFVSKCAAAPESLCPDLLNDSDSMFTQCLMHRAVRPQPEWKGNSSNSASIHHSAVAKTCAAISTLAHTPLPQPCCFSPFPIQPAFLFSSSHFLPFFPHLHHSSSASLHHWSLLPLSFYCCHSLKVWKGQLPRQLNGKNVQWGDILWKSKTPLLLRCQWFLDLSHKCNFKKSV